MTRYANRTYEQQSEINIADLCTRDDACAQMHALGLTYSNCLRSLESIFDDHAADGI